VEQKSLQRPNEGVIQCDRSLQREVNELSGENVGLCFHCRTCAGGCPFIAAMDYPPHGVLRLVQLGLRKEALECSTIWICVACNTCSIQCPMAIDIAAIMDALRHMALHEHAKIAEPDILEFHREVIDSMERYGRTHKLEIMLRYKLRVHQWFQDMDIGLKMLAKRKLDLMPSRVKNIGEMRDLFALPERDVGNGRK
jgi:heterodisulfide reductase subunit C